jgi:hypothetical protein
MLSRYYCRPRGPEVEAPSPALAVVDSLTDDASVRSDTASGAQRDCEVPNRSHTLALTARVRSSRPELSVDVSRAAGPTPETLLSCE